jgi:hypothetical protein
MAADESSDRRRPEEDKTRGVPACCCGYSRRLGVGGRRKTRKRPKLEQARVFCGIGFPRKGDSQHENVNKVEETPEILKEMKDSNEKCRQVGQSEEDTDLLGGRARVFFFWGMTILKPPAGPGVCPLGKGGLLLLARVQTRRVSEREARGAETRGRDEVERRLKSKADVLLTSRDQGRRVEGGATEEKIWREEERERK